MTEEEREYHELVQAIAANDVVNGDFVTLDRVEGSIAARELLLTFSNILIDRMVAKYAGNATSTGGEEDLG